MKFLEWNNCIASHFFGNTNAGKDCYLYITKADVINYGRAKLTGFSDDDIWSDFINKVKNGLPGSGGCPDIVGKAVYCYNIWNRGVATIEGVPVEYPTFILYLCFFILPLTEIDTIDNVNNYYNRLETFLLRNRLNQNLRNKLIELEPLWSGLLKWANITNDGKKGIFRVGNFVNPNWVYVGKIFSQCILSPKTVRELPELFLAAGMVPDTFYQDKEIVCFLTLYGPPVLGLKESVIDLIKKSDKNEFGKSIIELVKREYVKWTGESYKIITQDSTTKLQREYTSASLRLQFKINQNTGQLIFSYRLYSTNEYPEDLILGSNLINYERNGFSASIALPFNESIELYDNVNKWKAKSPTREVRIFASAATYMLSNSYWIETETLSRTDSIFILCKKRLTEALYQWAANHCSSLSDKSDLENLPAGYSLLKISCPTESFPGIPLLTLFKEKQIKIVEGLKLNFRTFLKEYPGQVEIQNSDGSEQVYVAFKKGTEKQFLLKNPDANNKWLLPLTLPVNVDFYISVENESFAGNELAYTFASADNTAMKLTDQALPKRDSFGKILQGQPSHFAYGSNIVGFDRRKQLTYVQFFTSINEDRYVGIQTPDYHQNSGNALLAFLTARQSNTVEDFYNAFEFFYFRYIQIDPLSNVNYSAIKKSSINFYDYLGFCDYDYERKQIIVNPPQFILIPSEKGRKVLLIGGRDNALVKQIIEKAPAFGLQIEVTSQLPSNKHLLLPDAITIKAFGNKYEGFGLKYLIEFAREINIKLDPDDLTQVALQLYSADINDYETDVLANNLTDENDYGWIRSVFNHVSLDFEKDNISVLDKMFSLVEYKFNEYTFVYKLWLNNKCYLIDRNWGKYLALKHYRKQVILYDNGKLAIPLKLPLPRLLAESILLLSGIAPEYARINNTAYRIYHNIPSPFAHNLFLKLGQTPIKQNL